MSWIQTYTGKQFFYDKIHDASQICLEDIAHSLSYICRYGGHAHKFYSVAEHSMAIAAWIVQEHNDHELAKQALLHDATEAYIGDMVRPLKMRIPDFEKYELDLATTLYSKYGLPPVLDARIKEADTRILINEKQLVFPPDKQLLWEMETYLKPLDNLELHGMKPEEVEPMFLAVLKEQFGKYDA